MEEKFIKLAKKYAYDDKALLKNHPDLENLYTFSKQGLGLVENIEFEATKKVLYIGEINIPRLKYILDRSEELIFFDKDISKKALLEVYFDRSEKFKFVNNLTNISNDRFDKIFIIGSLDEEYKLRLREYKALLAENGSLIVAVDNRYGLKYILGAKKDKFSLSIDELNSLINDLGLKATSVYYPFPDYKLPLSIYSDKYLPKKELGGDIAAYNYPKYSINSLGSLYNEVSENKNFDRFSNSFVFISNNKSKELLVKYNRNRKEEYAIKTVIYEEDSRLLVKKEALYEKGKEHIKKLAFSYDILSKENTRLTYLKPEFTDDFSCAYFEYIDGKGLDEILASKIKNGKLDRKYFKDILETIIGEGTVNIDANFDNFIVKDNRIIGIDYEWLAEEKLDKKYSYYRALKAFYFKYENLLTESLDDILKDFNINSDDIAKFDEDEENFQEKVHGENQEIYLDNYFVDFKSGEELEDLGKNYNILSKEVQVLSEDLKDRILAFDELMEIKRLTDNHVINLETIIEKLNADLEHESGMLIHMNNTLTHMNKHLSLTYKIYRKIKNKLFEKFPEGTVARRRLSYIKLCLRRPKYMLKLISTKEGRNRLEGDIKIGSNYLERGKLSFEYFDRPKVSIVIPVYNQIHYTYACLESILDNTKNISYEIIIADDVSTDATRELTKFVENVVVARNSINQGFLKNCNQAASRVRGEYILFLNNDTKVTHNWLDSLVKLIESDKTIGMVGSKLIYPDGRLQEAGGILWSDGSGWNYGRFDNPDKCEYNYVKDVDYISGASIMLSKKLWEDIGGFDERFAPAYCEDSDLAFEVRKRGLRVVYEPKSVVIHFEGISNGTDVNGSGLKKYQVENSIKLREKWKDEFAKQFANNDNPNAFRARERSKDKKIILFIDHYVPTFDKDAGSKTTYQYLKMLVKKGYIVKFLGDNFLKEEPYTSALEELGIEVLYGKEMQVSIFEWIKKNEENIHLVYLNRPHIAAKYIDFIKKNTKLKVIYYGHDLHFLREYREYELTGDKKHRSNSKYWKSIELSVMKKADISYYPSQVEVDYIADIDEEIRTKAITAYVYDSFKTDIDKDFSKREGLLFVGGFAHPPNKDALLWFIKNIWNKIREKVDINFYIVGSKADEEIKNLHNEEKGIIFKGFVSDEELEELYRKTKLVVVPLRYGAGVKGKVIEALYYNMPIVTTSVGAEGIKDASLVMSIKDNEDDFANEVLSLYNNNDMLGDISKKADVYIRENNSIEAVWKIVKEDFE